MSVDLVESDPRSFQAEGVAGRPCFSSCWIMSLSSWDCSAREAYDERITFTSLILPSSSIFACKCSKMAGSMLLEAILNSSGYNVKRKFTGWHQTLEQITLKRTDTGSLLVVR